jgi:DHA2 family multidrug resistance protein
MTPAIAQEKPAISPWVVAMVVSLAAFMEVLDTTITNVSLSHIAGSLAASQDESTWVLTSYLVSNGIVLPLSGWLANVMGRKRFFMMCIGGFTLASFACGMANSLGMLIFFRLLQGFAGGGLQPTQQSIILDAFPPDKRGAAFSVTGITMILAPIIGPTFGGWITDNFSWRWIFYINVPVGIMALLLVSQLVEDPPHAKAKGFRSIDYFGLLLVIIGLGSLQIVLDKGQQEDWFNSPFILTYAAISIICLISALIWLIKREDPIIDFDLFADRGFALGCFLIFLMGFALYGCSVLLPLLVQSQFGYDATLAGLVLSPGGFAIVILMPIVGRLTGFIQAKYLITIGLLACSYGMWYTMHLNPQVTYMDFVWMRIFQVTGLPFLFIPISVVAFMNIPKELNNKASALYSLCRNLGGSIGISIVATYVTRHEQMHQNYLVDNLA